MAYYIQFVLIPAYWLLVFAMGIWSAITQAFKHANWETSDLIASHKRHYGKK